MRDWLEEVLENHVLTIAEIIGQNFTLMHEGAPAHSAMDTKGIFMGVEE